MANIYLRVSKYIAAFMRADGDGNSIAPDQPIEFSPYTMEYTILANTLRIIPSNQQHRAACYSQVAWNNMLRGRQPQGGPTLLHRDPAKPLTYKEVTMLECIHNKQKLDDTEFLCISIPREVYSSGKVYRTNSTMTLDTEAARDLRRQLRRTFIASFIDFEKNNHAFAAQNRFNRSTIEVLERFLMIYDIPVSHDQKERDSLRRLVQRWRKEAALYAEAEVTIGRDTITRIDDHERRGGLPSYE